MRLRTSLFIVVMVVFPVSMFAQRYELEQEITSETDTSTYELDRYLDNPCTSWYDRIWVDYSVYVEQAYAESNDRFMFDEMTSVGGTYRAAGSTQSDVSYTAPFTLRKYHKVNTSDDFHVVTVITFYPSTRDTYVSVETACGNGLPDSKE